MDDGFRRGDLILTSRPFVYLLNNEQRGQRCDCCLQRSESLKPCERCQFFYFCSQDCEDRSKVTHKTECEYIKYLPSDTSTDDLLLLARVVFKLEDPKSHTESETVGPHTRTYKDLQSHITEVRNDPLRFLQFWFRYDDLQKFIRDRCPPQETVLEIFGKVLINSFSITDEESRDLIGRGLYLGASLLDHSCDPDAAYVFDGYVLSIRAVRDIPHRDYRKIYVTYVDPRGTTEARREELSQYYFTCYCRLCTDPLSDTIRTQPLDQERADAVISQSKETLQLLKQTKAEKGDVVRLLQEAESCLTDQEGVLSDCHSLRLDVMQQVVRLCCRLGRWKQAAGVAEKVVRPFRVLYGEFSPQVASWMLQTANLYIEAGNVGHGEKMLLEAEKIASVVFGTEHSLYRKLRKTIFRLSDQKSKEEIR